MKRSSFWVTLALLAFTLLMSAPPSFAVPMWSRRYGVTCSTCHQYPSLQLSTTGLDFFRRGHRMTGDTFDKDLTHLLSAHIEWEYEVEEKGSTAFNQPDLHLHAGGAVSPLFSLYVDANINSDFEASYLQFTKGHGDSSYFTARAGKFIPTIVRNYGMGLMASASTPLILTDATLGTNPFTPARDSFGISLAGRMKPLFVEAGVINGEDVPMVATVANHKDVYASAEYALHDGVSGVGLYYHRGGYDLGNPPLSPLAFDRYDRQGVFANFTRNKFRLAGAYLSGKDEIEGLPEDKMHGYFVQVDLHPAEPAVPFARYETVKMGLASSKVKKGVVGCSFRLYESEMTGGRLALEVSRTDDGVTKTNAGLLNVIWIF